MTNYYEELKLDPKASAKDLIEELIRQEVVWHQREINAPEEAAKKQVLITEAKKAFASEASKAQYDQELNAKPVEEKQADPEAERREQYKYWYDQAKQYYQSKTFDLAKTAVEKAMNYASSDQEDPYFYELAANIYRTNQDYSTAMSYINKAIVLKGDDATFHLEKGMICDRQYRTIVKNGYGETDPIVRMMREEYKQADIIATGKDNSLRGIILGELARSLYFYSPRNEELAEEIAETAVSFGDGMGHGKEVLNDLAEKRRKAKENEEKRRKDEEERKRKAEQDRLAREQAERERMAKEATEKHRNKLSIILFILSIFGMVGATALALLSGNRIGPFSGIPSWLLIILFVACVGVYNYCAFYRYIDEENWCRFIWLVLSAVFIFFIAAFRGTWATAGITAGLIALAIFVSWLISKKMRVVK